MADDFESLKRQLTQMSLSGDTGNQIDRFAVLADLAALVSRTGHTSQTTELVIRALDIADQFARERPLLIALARDHGLYPYITDQEGRTSSNDLPLRDAIAMEMHRPLGLDVFFHSVQAQVYQRLLNGENVILSAPTSFGKSLIVDSLVAANHLRNVVIIVPTIALMDETRRRLSSFRNYKIVTHPGQAHGDRNLFVLTQERYLTIKEMPDPDFFFIDEFYKANDETDDSLLTGRAALLNEAIRKLMKTGAQFYMAGPNIAALDELLPQSMQAAFIRTDYATVAADTVKLSATNDGERRSEILRVLDEADGAVLIFCQSPRRVREVVRWITENGAAYGPGMPDTASWVEKNYSSRWSFANALRAGVGAHHGRLPRWLAQEVVEGFNSGRLKVLVCTNSLIEGVNTRAKNIIILDKKIATKTYDYFTFANIRGRAGRMLKHFVGKIYLFHEPPQRALPEVDIPGLTQSESAPSSLLLAIDENERTDRSRERLAPILDQSLLSQETLVANVGVEPEKQIALAKHLMDIPLRRVELLRWSNAYPTYHEVGAVAELIWDYLPPDGYRSHGAVSASQLTLFVFRASMAEGDVGAVIDTFTQAPEHWSSNETIDDRIELAFDFLRFWIDHNLPSLLRTVSSIAAEVFEKRKIESGDFNAFAARVEAGFHPPMLMTLEEFGIPASVGRSLVRRIPRYDSLDELLALLKRLDVDEVSGISSYERYLIRRALETA